MGIPMLKIRQPWDRLIFNMWISILVRQPLYIETAPQSLCIFIELNVLDIFVSFFEFGVTCCMMHMSCHHKLLPTSVGHLIQLSHAVVIPRLYKKWFMITQQARLLELLHWHLIQHYNEWSHRYGLWVVLKPHWFKMILQNVDFQGHD